MANRGSTSGLIVGLAFAVVSGAALAFSVTQNATGRLIGVAIAASVLPPVVNSGMCLSYGLIAPSFQNTDGGMFLVYSGISFVLFLVNVVAIFLVGLLVFKIKAIAPFRLKSQLWKELPSVANLQLTKDEQGEAFWTNNLATVRHVVDRTKQNRFPSILQVFQTRPHDTRSPDVRPRGNVGPKNASITTGSVQLDNAFHTNPVTHFDSSAYNTSPVFFRH